MIDAPSRRSLADFPFIGCPCFESIMNRARLAGKTAKKRSYPARKGGLSVPLLWLLLPFVRLLGAYFPWGNVAFQVACHGGHWIYFFLRSLSARPASPDFSSQAGPRSQGLAGTAQTHSRAHRTPSAKVRQRKRTKFRQRQRLLGPAYTAAELLLVPAAICVQNLCSALLAPVEHRLWNSAPTAIGWGIGVDLESLSTTGLEELDLEGVETGG